MKAWQVGLALAMATAASDRGGVARAQGNRPRGPVVVSPEVKEDRRVVLRVLAPKAEAVTVSAGDIPGGGNKAMTKGAEGVWEWASEPVEPGAYRYSFQVDGVPVDDPRNPAVSESNGRSWSLVVVPGSPTMDRADVPHGAVAEVFYRSKSLGRDRRMHVYTPPGYETGSDKYPVFYLLHGAGDCDDSWTSVGRANFILDNLIAAGKARPMVVVMPAGHIAPGGSGPPPGPPAAGERRPATFEDDFLGDVVPYVEAHYRVVADRAHRAIAGLSMGGGQTLNVAFTRPEMFASVGVFSSAIFQKVDDWEKAHEAALGAAAQAEGHFRPLWLATGTADSLMNRTRETVALLKKRSLDPEFVETKGGHTWLNWRDYLVEFAPRLFP